MKYILKQIKEPCDYLTFDGIHFLTDNQLLAYRFDSKREAVAEKKIWNQKYPKLKVKLVKRLN